MTLSSLLGGILLSLGVAATITACTPQQVKDAGVTQNPTAVADKAAGTESCMTCHGDGTVMNEKIQNARDGWLYSAHANGVSVPLKDGADNIIEHVAEGPNSFYANAGSCVVCHTKEGFLNNIAGKYNDPAELEKAVIKAPSSLTCFTCHKPHTNGNFALTIPSTHSVTLTSGGVYDKNKGSICASCHQGRTPATGANVYVTTTLGGSSGVGARFGPHYGVQSDMLLGKGGAEYTGKTYTNSPHTSNKDANCVTCHMTYPDARFSGSAGLAGHSFEAVAMVHGAQKGNAAGCISCHSGAKASNATAAKGHLQVGDAYFIKSSTDKAYDEFNTLMTALVNPTSNGDGLLQRALQLNTVGGATASIVFTDDGRYKISSLKDSSNGKSYSLKEANATNEGSPKARVAKAMFNYTFVWEDKSFGVHNTSYAKQLLWDSANDLKTLLNDTTTDIGTRP